MRHWFLYFIFGVAALALQSVWPIAANLFLIAVLFLGLEEEESRKGLGISLLLGFFLDVTSAAPFGCALFSFSFIFGLTRWLRRKILLLSPLSQGFWIVILTLLHGLFTYLWLQAWEIYPRPLFFYFRHQFWSALFNGIISFFLFPFFRWYRHVAWRKIFARRDPFLR